MEYLILIAAVVILIILVVRFGPLMVVSEGHVGLLYRDGRLAEELPPGLHFKPAWHVRLERVDVRRRLLAVTGQEVLTGDNVTVKISLQAEFRVADAMKAVREASDWNESVYSALQLALRDAVASRTFDEVMKERAAIGGEIHQSTAAAIASIGIELIGVTVRDVMLPADLRRAFAEAVRLREEGKAALEKARAETAALRSLANAARMLKDNPELLNVRLLQILEAAGAKSGNTLVFGAPFDLQAMTDAGRGRKKAERSEDT